MENETIEVNGQPMTLEEFVAACEAQAENARRFFEAEPVECHDLDLTLVAALIDEKFPETPPIIGLSQEDFTLLLTGGIQIGYTLARRVDAGLQAAEEAAAADEGDEDGEAAGEAEAAS